MLKTELILTFLDVIKLNSFTAAARKNKVSPAAVSKQISALEAELGIQLLNRSTRKIQISEPGLLFYEQAQRIVNELQETQNLVRSLQKEPIGPLHVISSIHFGEQFILPYLNEFQSLFPKILLNLELNETAPSQYKSHESPDILFGFSMAGPSDWIQRKIGETRYIFCASPEYLKAYGIPKNPKDLLHHKYITHKMRPPFLEFEDGLQLQFTPSLILNQTQAMLQSALQGLGIVQLHQYGVEKALQEGKLVEVLKGFARTRVPLYLYYPSRRYLQPKVREFIEFFSGKVQRGLKTWSRA